MSEILTNFGIDWPAFIAQVIAFSLVLFVLKRYAFGPIITVLEERRRRIAEGQANAEKIKLQLAESERKYQEMLDRANTQAQALINEARASSDALAQRRQEEATAEAQRIVARAHEATVQEHDRVLNEVKRELGRLVIDTTARVTGKILTPEDRARLDAETAGQINGLSRN
jgi:F-type H+-transporting ATPase subunit b